MYQLALIFLCIGYFKYIFLPLFPELVEAVYGTYPDWFPTFALAAIVWGLITLPLLFMKKKLGTYLVIGSVLAWIQFDIFVFDLHWLAMISYVGTVIFVFWVFLSRWKTLS